MAAGSAGLAHRVGRAQLAAGGSRRGRPPGTRHRRRGARPRSLWLALIGFSFGGVAHGVKNVLLRTLIHERAPEALRGRAFAAYNGARNGAELGALVLGGIAVGALGARTALLLAGLGPAAIGAACLLLLINAPPRRGGDHHQPKGEFSMHASKDELEPMVIGEYAGPPDRRRRDPDRVRVDAGAVPARRVAVQGAPRRSLPMRPLGLPVQGLVPRHLPRRDRRGRPRRRGVPPAARPLRPDARAGRADRAQPRRGARPHDGDRSPGTWAWWRHDAARSTGYSAKSIDELPTLWDGFAKLVRAGLDITAFGANIMDLPPDYSTTSHDEAESGQQELYVALRGSGSVDIDGAPPAAGPRPPRAGRRRDGASPVVRVRRACASSASAAYPAASTSRRTGAPQEGNLASRDGSLDQQSVAASWVVGDRCSGSGDQIVVLGTRHGPGSDDCICARWPAQSRDWRNSRACRPSLGRLLSLRRAHP